MIIGRILPGQETKWINTASIMTAGVEAMMHIVSKRSRATTDKGGWFAYG